MICLLLVALLTATMAIPAMAGSANGNGNYSSYSYSWAVTNSTSYGLANIQATAAPVSVGAYVYNEVINPITGVFDYVGSDPEGDPSYNYIAVTVSAGNTLDNGTKGVVRKTWATFYVAGAVVVSNVAVTPN